MGQLKEISGNVAGGKGYELRSPYLKRTTRTDELDRDLGKRQCLDLESATYISRPSHIDDTSTLSSTTDHRIRPASGSLRDEIEQHKRERVYERVIAWRTDLHLRILNVRFVNADKRVKKPSVNSARNPVKEKMSHNIQTLMATGQLQDVDRIVQQSAMMRILKHYQLVRAKSVCRPKTSTRCP